MSVWVVLSLTLMIAALFRWAVGLWGYSGNPSDIFSFALASTVAHLRMQRTSIAAHVWRLRGAKTLDGGHDKSAYHALVLS